MMEKKSSRKTKQTVLVFIILVLAVLILYELSGIGSDLDSRRQKSVYDAVRRAAFQCYAVEGVYPDSLGYLETSYGLMINHDKFIVSYDCYASNRPPKVQVLKR